MNELKNIPTEELVKELIGREKVRVIVKCFPQDRFVTSYGTEISDNHLYKDDMLLAINTAEQHD